MKPRLFSLPRNVVLGTGGVLLIIALIYVLNSQSGPARIEQFGRTRPIQLDVQNGSGEAKLAQRVTDFLRASGCDVVEMGNYKNVNVPLTLVIDRTGNIDAATTVAKILGIAEKQVVQHIDKNLFLDVTVVIGKDYPTLKPFR